MAFRESWRFDVVVESAVSVAVSDRLRFEFETAVNRFAADIEARLRHELGLPALTVRPIKSSTTPHAA